MTKTLTEQWHDGELKMITYYVRLKNGRICRCLHTGSKIFMKAIDGLDEQVQEVLAPVPDYMDCKKLMYDSIELDKAKIKIYELVSKTEQLEKKLEIVTRALKGVYVWANTGNGGEKAVKKVCEKALKEMEGVK